MAQAHRPASLPLRDPGPHAPASVIQAGRMRALSPGQCLFPPLEPGTLVYVVEGAVLRHVATRAGRRAALDLVAPDDLNHEAGACSLQMQ